MISGKADASSIYSGLLTYLVKVEWEVSGDRAIETRLQEGRPPVTETMRSAPVVFTDSRHTRVDGLRTRKLHLVNFTVESARRENFIFLPRKMCHGEKGRANEWGNPVSAFTRAVKATRTFPGGAKRRAKIARNFLRRAACAKCNVPRELPREMRFAKYTVEYIGA